MMDWSDCLIMLTGHLQRPACRFLGLNLKQKAHLGVPYRHISIPCYAASV
jgi:hypothetical protein